MSEINELTKAKIPSEDNGIELKRTLCDICCPGMHCGVNAYVKDGKIIKIEGTKEHPRNHGKLCTKGGGKEGLSRFPGMRHIRSSGMNCLR